VKSGAIGLGLNALAKGAAPRRRGRRPLTLSLGDKSPIFGLWPLE
jgi:hypothetical protein